MVRSKCHNVTFVDINFRHTQFENLTFSVEDSSTALLGLVKIFVGLVRNFVALVDLNFTSPGASKM